MNRPKVLYLEDSGIIRRQTWFEARCDLVSDQSELTGDRNIVYISSFLNTHLESMLEKTIHLLDKVDAFIVNSGEWNGMISRVLARFDDERMIWFIPGEAHFETKAKLVNNFAWLESTADKYFNNRMLSWALSGLEPYTPKPLYFDVLLGVKKPHRDLAYEFCKKNGLDKTNVLRYLKDSRGVKKTVANRHEDFGDDLADLMTQPIEYTVNQPIAETDASFSQIIPNRIYQQTAYSLIAETEYAWDGTFYTEKTAKPLLAQRLFIVLGTRYHLRDLRNLGFKTFDVIVDESYDEMAVHKDRWRAAMEEMKRLCELDQERVLHEIRPITEHNRKYYMTGKYLKPYFDELQKAVLGDTQ